MNKANRIKKFIHEENVQRLSVFERMLYIGLVIFSENGKISANPAYLRSVVFPYDDVPLDAVQNALKNVCEKLCLSPETYGENEFISPLDAAFRSQEEKENTTEEKRKVTKESKKKAKKERQESPLISPRGMRRFPPFFERKQSTSVHFENERKYTPEQLEALITDIDDIDI